MEPGRDLYALRCTLISTSDTVKGCIDILKKDKEVSAQVSRLNININKLYSSFVGTHLCCSEDVETNQIITP